MTQTLNSFYKPKSVAIIGASSNPGKLSHGIIRNLVQGSYSGDIFPINPGSSEILGMTSYKTIENVPKDVDLAVIVLPANLIPEALISCGEKGVRAAIIISGGFKEIGPSGAILEQQCAAIGKRYSMRLIGPNCVGTLDLYSGLNTTFIKGIPEKGHIGFVSQSGAVCGAVVDIVQDLGIGFSSMASLGNEMDVNETDIIEYLWKEENTRVICAYVESIHDGGRFIEIASKVTRDKPIVLLKAGRSGAGAQAVSSHTGSIAGSYDAYLAAFKQSGVTVVNTLQELIDVSLGFSLQPLPGGKNTVIITNSGGPAALAADTLEVNDLALPVLQPQVQQNLAKVLPPNSQVMNPIDMLGGADQQEYSAAIQGIMAEKDIHNAVIILTPQALVNPLEIAEAILLSTKNREKTIISCFVGGTSIPDARRFLHKNNIPMYIFPDQPGRVLGAMLEHRSRLEKKQIHEDKVIQRDQAGAGSIIQLLRSKRIIGEAGTRPLLEAYHIPVIPGGTAASAQQSLIIAEDIGFPVVMKIAAEDVFHKSEIGGVILNLENGTDVITAFNDLKKRYQNNNLDHSPLVVLIEKMASRGHEVIIGMKRDPTFGPLMMLGMGGTMVELTRDVSFRIAPLRMDTVLEMISELNTGSILYGFRGSQPADVQKLAEIMISLGQMALDFPIIQEIEINPLMLLDDGKGAYALDARMVLS